MRNTPVIGETYGDFLVVFFSAPQVPILVRTAAPHPSAVGVVLLVRAPGAPGCWQLHCISPLLKSTKIFELKHVPKINKCTSQQLHQFGRIHFEHPKLTGCRVRFHGDHDFFSLSLSISLHCGRLSKEFGAQTSSPLLWLKYMQIPEISEHVGISCDIVINSVGPFASRFLSNSLSVVNPAMTCNDEHFSLGVLECSKQNHII